MTKAVKGGVVAATALGLALLVVARFAPDWLSPPAEEPAVADVAPPASDAASEATASHAGRSESAAAPTGTAPAGRIETHTATAPGADPEAPVVTDAVGSVAPLRQAGIDAGRPVDVEAPVLDIVRVDAEGEAVIAGTAPAGAAIEVLIDGTVVATSIAGADGNFVVIASLGRSVVARALQLRVRKANGAAAGVEMLTLVETEDLPGDADASLADASGSPPGSDAEVAAADPDAGGVEPRYALSEPVVLLPSAGDDAAPLVMGSTAAAVTLLQPQQADTVDVVLDRITYESGGDVLASGRGHRGHAVRAYADGRFVADVPVGADGLWGVVLPRGIAETTRLLRFDEVAADGTVTSRLETGFGYDIDGGAQETRERRIVVRRGDSLWRIAEKHYGQGLRYSLIFTANSGLIRDPDLIYPDQVFTIPELVAAED